MSRVVVVTNPELAPGFQLAGVHTLAAEDAQEASALLDGLLADAEVGVIGVQEPFLAAWPAATRQRLEGLVQPVVVALPAGVDRQGAEVRRAQLAALLQRAVGYRIRFAPETP